MKKLIEGLHRFHYQIVGPRREFFNRLSKRHEPPTLFITCSDARIDPNLICQTDPGELFIMRNAGNIVPPAVTPGTAVAVGGEQATVEFAVDVLRVQDIVVCGHTHCGAMTALAMHTPLEGLPSVHTWLQHAALAAEIVEREQPELEGKEKVLACVRMNIRVQLLNLAQHPSVLRAAQEQRLRLHGWLYEIETGVAHAYEPDTGAFLPLIKP